MSARGGWSQKAPLSSGSLLVVQPGVAGAYQTIQAGITGGAARALTVGSAVDIAPGSYTENDTVPAGGWQLRGFMDRNSKTTQTGTIVWSPADGSVLTLENFYCAGATISGALASGTARLFLNHMAIDATLAFTGGTVHVNGTGGYIAGSSAGAYVGAISTTGTIQLDGYDIPSALTTTGDQPIKLTGCRFAAPSTITTAGTSVVVKGCDASALVAFVFSGSAGIVTADEYSLSQLLANGATVTNGVFASKRSLGMASTLTLATDIITITGGVHAVDTEAAAATDNLATINGGAPNQLLVLYAADSARTVVAKDGTGNLKLSGGDFSMDNAEDRLLLISDALGTTWYELGRNDSGA
jgi:hypothetical protein